jgi:hypothetical protein
LEVAKSLQVKGLCEANPSDILSKQVMPGASPAMVAAMANRLKQQVNSQSLPCVLAQGFMNKCLKA